MIFKKILNLIKNMDNSNDNKYSNLWNNDFKQIFIENNTIPIYISTNSEVHGPNIICLHGAGHSGLSFSLLSSLSKTYRIISYDYRDHGYNTFEPKNDLSIETLISDTEKVLMKINELYPKDTMIILGHSLGGGVAVKTCKHILSTEFNKDLYEKIQGLIVVDVVEGSAKEAIPFMMNVVNNKQKEFNNIEDAIKYMNNTQIHNLESCNVSIPPLLYFNKNNKKYEWKTDLVKTEKYWDDWYKNLSNEFLSIKVPKNLILNDTSELDTPLTIGHMQGKFKLTVIKGTGHFIHEDSPKVFLDYVEEFIKGFRIPSTTDEIKLIQSKLGNQEKIIKYVEFKS
jgi:protein phosphatase methylesterase 1